MLKVMSAFLGRDKGQVPAVTLCARESNVDVLCLQEVMSFELTHLKSAYRFMRFVPMTRLEDGSMMGLATCANWPVKSISEHYYEGDATTLSQFDESTPERVNETKRRPLLVCDIICSGCTYSVGNTHFLYSKEGRWGKRHYTATRSLIGALKKHNRIILCGAMVMVRDSGLYEDFVNTSDLKDWVPRSIECTLDKDLHKLSALLKNGGMPKVVVDYVFAAGYRPADKVRQFEGVSDHTPLLATVA